MYTSPSLFTRCRYTSPSLSPFTRSMYTSPSLSLFTRCRYTSPPLYFTRSMYTPPPLSYSLTFLPLSLSFTFFPRHSFCSLSLTHSLTLSLSNTQSVIIFYRSTKIGLSIELGRKQKNKSKRHSDRGERSVGICLITSAKLRSQASNEWTNNTWCRSFQRLFIIHLFL